MKEPTLKPSRPFFASGPCAKRPGWSAEALSGAFLGRSHRSSLGKARLHEVLELMLADWRQGWELRDSTWSRDPNAEGEGVHATLLARAPFG